MMPALYIFDADGTLRRTLIDGQPCPHGPGEWALLAHVRETLGLIPWSTSGPFAAVASNQDHVGSGLLDGLLAEQLLRDMVEDAFGLVEPAPLVRFCPHGPDDGCGCRKPAPGMLRGILEHFGVPPHAALFIGDEPCDREAARRAGIPFTPADLFFGRP